MNATKNMAGTFNRYDSFLEHFCYVNVQIQLYSAIYNNYEWKKNCVDLTSAEYNSYWVLEIYTISISTRPEVSLKSKAVKNLLAKTKYSIVSVVNVFAAQYSWSKG